MDGNYAIVCCSCQVRVLFEKNGIRFKAVGKGVIYGVSDGVCADITLYVSESVPGTGTHVSVTDFGDAKEISQNDDVVSTGDHSLIESQIEWRLFINEHN
ncbi:hypothetical protein J6590_057667 [Homalodisca vitripennis]|nr:hypothetical protein J6590_057667 [Homalodisca vitripennis]